MNDQSLAAFFDNYLAAWPDAGKVADCYAEPFTAARGGRLQLNPIQPDTQKFFERVLEAYRSRGFASARILRLESMPLGAHSAFATVAWAYLDEAGNTLWEWTFSYNLYMIDGRWQIVLQTLHEPPSP